jgi:hypothetical protein
MISKGLDFSRMNVQATRESLSKGGSVVYKDKYYNSQVKKYNKSTKRGRKTTVEMRMCLVLAMKCNRNYEGALDLLSSKGLGSVKESYWDMSKRVGSYGEEALKSWIVRSQPISFYKANFGV